MAHNRWTTDEIEFVETNYGKMPIIEIAKSLSRTRSAVDAMLSRLRRLGKITNLLKHWSQDEDLFLRAKYPTMPNKQISVELGRTLPSIRARAVRLGVMKRPKCSVEIQLSIPEAAYLAGMIDGDGSISFSADRDARIFTPGLTIYNTDTLLFDWIGERLDFLRPYLVVYRGRQLKIRKEPKCWQLRFSRRSGLKQILDLLLPFLVLKRRRAELVLEFLRIHKHRSVPTLKELKIVLEVLELNAWKPNSKTRYRLRKRIAELDSC